MKPALPVLILLAIVAASVSACGQRGPLRLSDPPGEMRKDAPKELPGDQHRAKSTAPTENNK